MRYRWHYLTGMVLMTIHNYGYMKIPVYMRKIMEEVSGENRLNVVVENALYTLGYLIVTCFFMYHMRNFIISSSRKVEYDFRKDLFYKLMHLPLSFYRKEQTGDLVSRIINDLNDIRTMVGPGIMYIPNSLTRMLFFAPVMFTLSPKLMTAILIQMAVLIVIILIIMPRLRPFYRKVQESKSDINNEAWQLASGISTIKINTMERLKLGQFDKKNDQYMAVNLRLALIEQFTWPVFLLIFAMSEVIILLVGGSAIINGEMTKEELLQFTIMLGVLTFPIFSLGWVLSLLQQGISALERVKKIFLHETFDGERNKTLSNNPHHINIKGLTVYDDEQNKVLDRINLEIKHGQMIGLTGKTGSGKTVLLECLLGLIRPNEGVITIDGIDISTIKIDSLYNEIGFVPQEPFLFSETIKNNIGLEEAQKVDFPRVKNSAKNADVAKDIQTFKKRYDEQIGERGITLSGGQKQRTALSRALYKREAMILILDDSLSSVDSETEENIINNLKKFQKKFTVIVVSHKISLLKIADKIHCLDKGKIVESGSHNQLMKKGGLYSKTAKLQELESSIAKIK